jgi:hypothetical protein
VSEEPAITISSRDFKRLDQLLDSLPHSLSTGEGKGLSPIDGEVAKLFAFEEERR